MIMDEVYYRHKKYKKGDLVTKITDAVPSSSSTSPSLSLTSTASPTISGSGSDNTHHRHHKHHHHHHKSSTKEKKHDSSDEGKGNGVLTKDNGQLPQSIVDGSGGGGDGSGGSDSASNMTQGQITSDESLKDAFDVMSMIERAHRKTVDRKGDTRQLIQPLIDSINSAKPKLDSLMSYNCKLFGQLSQITPTAFSKIVKPLCDLNTSEDFIKQFGYHAWVLCIMVTAIREGAFQPLLVNHDAFIAEMFGPPLGGDAP